MIRFVVVSFVVIGGACLDNVKRGDDNPLLFFDKDKIHNVQI